MTPSGASSQPDCAITPINLAIGRERTRLSASTLTEAHDGDPENQPRAALTRSGTASGPKRKRAIRAEPLMGGLIHSGVLHHPSFERALAYRVALKLGSNEMSDQILREIATRPWLLTIRWPLPPGPISWRSLIAIRRATATCSPCCSSRASRPCRPIGWPLAVRQGRRDLAYFVQMRRQRDIRGGYPSRRADRQGHHDRSRPFHRHWRNGSGG